MISDDTVNRLFYLLTLLTSLLACLLAVVDVKSLSDVTGIRAYQDSVLDSFTRHSAERHGSGAGRVTHLIARLAELTRASVVAREILAPYQASGRIPQHSLLYELLRGDGDLH